MYPILLNLKDRPVLVVGGGRVAARKIDNLLEEEARITVVSPKINSDIDVNRIIWIQRKYQQDDRNGFDLIFACTDEPELNEQIYNQAVSGAFVNNASDKEKSDFYNMKVIQADDYIFSVSSKGQNYRNTKKIGNNLKRWLDDNLEELLK